MGDTSSVSAHRRVLILAVALVALASGCGDDDNVGASAKSSPSASSTSPVAEPTEKREGEPTVDASTALREAVRGMKAEPSVRFSQVFTVMQKPVQTLNGSQHRPSQSWEARMELGDLNGTKYTAILRYADATTWMQMVDWPEPMTGCWLEMDPAAMPEEAGFVDFELPSAVVILDDLRAERYSEGTSTTMHATLSAQHVGSLLPGRMRTLIKGAGQGQPRVPVKVTLVGERLDKVELEGGEILRLIDESEVDEARDLLEAALITVSYPVADSPAPVRRPQAASVVTAAEMEAKKGCRHPDPDGT